MREKELEIAKREAWSFTGTKPPNGSVEIGQLKQGDCVYTYYRDTEGNYWYSTLQGLVFERYMQEVQERKKHRKYAGTYYGRKRNNK